jgi:atypical dual specificity phosphatase
VWQIIPGLFLGDREDARDRQLLKREGITHIVNCAAELSCHFEREFIYLSLKLKDPDPAFGSRIERVCDFIDAGRRDGKVLVHCTAAVSRSPAVILAYLCHRGDTLDHAVQRLRQVVLTGIDDLFLQQLVEHLRLAMSATERESLALKLLGR